jgi:hypothetical protein
MYVQTSAEENKSLIVTVVYVSHILPNPDTCISKQSPVPTGKDSFTVAKSYPSPVLTWSGRNHDSRFVLPIVLCRIRINGMDCTWLVYDHDTVPFSHACMAHMIMTYPSIMSFSSDG